MPNQDPNIQDTDVVVLDPLDTEASKKAFETTLAQKKHFREKYEREAAVNAALQKKLEEYEKASKLPTEETPEPPKPAGLDQDALLDNLEVIRDLATDELADMRAEAKNLGVDVIKYAKSKAGQAHLKELRSTKKSQDSTPTPSNRIPQFNGKPATAALTDDKSSPADKQKAFEAMMKKGSNSSA